MPQQDFDGLPGCQSRTRLRVEASGGDRPARRIEGDLGGGIQMAEHDSHLESASCFPDTCRAVCDRRRDEDSVGTEGSIGDRTAGLRTAQDSDQPIGHGRPDPHDAFVAAGQERRPIRTEGRAVDKPLVVESFHEQARQERVHPRITVVAEGQEQPSSRTDRASFRPSLAAGSDRPKQFPVTRTPEANQSRPRDCQHTLRVACEERSRDRSSCIELAERRVSLSPDSSRAVPASRQDESPVVVIGGRRHRAA